jgi:hypothetical protein
VNVIFENFEQIFENANPSFHGNHTLPIIDMKMKVVKINSHWSGDSSDGSFVYEK